MNICGPGYCCCDGSDVIGEDPHCEAYYSTRESFVDPEYCYYWSPSYGVVLSVEPEDMVEGVQYFFDPELTELIG